MAAQRESADAPAGFRHFVARLCSPFWRAFNLADRWYSRWGVIALVLTVLAGAGLLTWADVAAWLLGGWWFAVLTGGANVLVLAWLISSHREAVLCRTAVSLDVRESAPAAGPDQLATPFSVTAVWEGMGWQRDGQGEAQPYCLDDETPLMVGDESLEQLGLFKASSDTASEIGHDGLGFLQCPACHKVYALPRGEPLKRVRPYASEVLVGALRRARGDRPSG